MDEYVLSDRKKLILQAVVDAHVRFGEPVGSKTLAQNQHLTCSSATIRNEMAELEAMGLLEQPHTSAGRVPTELGYRYYVNSLMERYSTAAAEVEQMSASLKRRMGEMDQLLAEASRLASSLTNYPALAVKAAPVGGVYVTRFEAIYVEERRFLLVMIFSGGAIRTATMEPLFPISQADLNRLVSAIDRLLVGKPAEALNLPLLAELEAELEGLTFLVGPVVKTVFDTMQQLGGKDLRVEGVNRLLQYPEYEDKDELRRMISLFEDKEDLLDAISPEDVGEDGVRVLIGSESSVSVMNNSALIYRPVKRGGRVIGAIGIIGPRRMDYAKVISTVDQLASGVDRLLGEELPAIREKGTDSK